ncbi:hypothetical protein TOPH_00894 [Tolypocladium ophioglossoides CBS 100239]|uniref:Uncharacterized protein n=1 Tax=Tolypocladium ophioglossoides (strain CBS 100239) TaxID=1163406 RepID=A0A0L0NL83_TOLOC|nr:hypothetical protein TOPH_00894 [Tolypocladium ophioglossoides CBS 100239]
MNVLRSVQAAEWLLPIRVQSGSAHRVSQLRKEGRHRVTQPDTQVPITRDEVEFIAKIHYHLINNCSVTKLDCSQTRLQLDLMPPKTRNQAAKGMGPLH